MDGLDRILLSEANPDQLEHVWRFERTPREEFEVVIFIRGYSNTRSLSDLETERMQAYYRSRGDMLAKTLGRTAEGGLRWVVTLFPTAAYAQDAEMSLDEFEDLVYRACYADQEDAIASWEAIDRDQERLAAWLTGKKSIELTGSNVDLRLSGDPRWS